MKAFPPAVCVVVGTKTAHCFRCPHHRNHKAPVSFLWSTAHDSESKAFSHRGGKAPDYLRTVREIQREWLEQMAASYNPAVYTALINLEHIKSYLPDSTFNRYGKVTALFAEEITEGPLAGKMALYADVEPNGVPGGAGEKRPEIIHLYGSQPEVC